MVVQTRSRAKAARRATVLADAKKKPYYRQYLATRDMQYYAHGVDYYKRVLALREADAMPPTHPLYNMVSRHTASERRRLAQAQIHTNGAVVDLVNMMH